MELRSLQTMISLPELVNYQYGYIGYCIVLSWDEAKKYLALAEKNIDILESRNHDMSGPCLQMCLPTVRIGLNKLSAR
jgi:hypothetical protein